MGANGRFRKRPVGPPPLLRLQRQHRTIAPLDQSHKPFQHCKGIAGAGLAAVVRAGLRPLAGTPHCNAARRVVAFWTDFTSFEASQGLLPHSPRAPAASRPSVSPLPPTMNGASLRCTPLPAAAQRCSGGRRALGARPRLTAVAAGTTARASAAPATLSGAANNAVAAPHLATVDVGRSTNIRWHQSMVSRGEKELLLGQRGCVLWFTGARVLGGGRFCCMRAWSACESTPVRALRHCEFSHALTCCCFHQWPANCCHRGVCLPHRWHVGPDKALTTRWLQDPTLWPVSSRALALLAAHNVARTCSLTLRCVSPRPCQA